MHVVRGSLSDVADDRRVTRGMTRFAERTAERALRVWRPPRQVAFGRRDSILDGYRRARRIASERGYVPVERNVGGSAVAYTGSTVAFAVAVPIERERCGIDHRYQDALSILFHGLENTGAVVSRGEPSGSFCPGEYSLQGEGKIAGIAQRVRRESALVGGCVIPSKADERTVSGVLKPVYDALERPFDPASVGSVERAGGPVDVEEVLDSIEKAFLGDREPTVVRAVEISHDCPL